MISVHEAPSSVTTITAERTMDVDFIDSVCMECLPSMVTDQHHEFISARGMVGLPEILFIAVAVDGVDRGIIAMYKNSIHTMFLPPLRGRLAVRGMIAALGWIDSHTSFDRVISHVYSHRRDALLFAKRCGFMETGRENDGTTINGDPVEKINLENLNLKRG